MHVAVITIHPEAELFALKVTLGLCDRNNPDPVPLRQDALCGEAHAMRVHQLLRGTVDSIVRKSCHWVDLKK